jgi:steroid delta-isomerase-like uncharacterized protein
MGEEATDTERVVQDAFDWLNGDSSKIEAIAESVDVYGPALPDGEVHSRDEWASFIGANREGFPDIEFSMQELVVGDTVAMAELTLSGTHQGEFMGVPPTGREIEIRAIDKFVVEDGQVVEWRPYFDSRQIPEQLGLRFPTVLVQLPKLVWWNVRTSLPAGH